MQIWRTLKFPKTINNNRRNLFLTAVVPAHSPIIFNVTYNEAVFTLPVSTGFKTMWFFLIFISVCAQSSYGSFIYLFLAVYQSLSPDEGLQIKLLWLQFLRVQSRGTEIF